MLINFPINIITIDIISIINIRLNIWLMNIIKIECFLFDNLLEDRKLLLSLFDNFVNK
jgi:hypothetical protein